MISKCIYHGRKSLLLLSSGPDRDVEKTAKVRRGGRVTETSLRERIFTVGLKALRQYLRLQQDYTVRVRGLQQPFPI